MKLFTVDIIGEAREKILKACGHPVSPLVKTTTISLNDLTNPASSPANKADPANTVGLIGWPGCVLAEDLFAGCDIPAFRRSTVDGYAVVAADTAAAGESIPVFLKQIGSVSMGQCTNLAVHPGECAYVPTGGMIPAGADAMVMVEYAEAAGENIAVYEAVAPGTGVTEPGEDLKKGAPLLTRGKILRAQETGALAAAGITMLRVFAPLTLTLISTGDELVPPQQEPRPGEVRDINTHALKALAVRRGYMVLSTQVLPDNEERLETAIREAMAASDVVAISGGSSQGEKDLTAKIIGRIAKPGVFTHGLAVKPGKPTILGWDDASKTLLAGLPGHPVSAMMVFEITLGWLIDTLFCRPLPFPVPARISCNVPGSPGRTVLLPVALRNDGETYSAEPVFGKAGMIVTLTQADGYTVIDLNKEGLKKDEPIMVHLFS